MSGWRMVVGPGLADSEVGSAEDGEVRLQLSDVVTTSDLDDRLEQVTKAIESLRPAPPATG